MAIDPEHTASTAPPAPALLETARLTLTRPDPGDEADLATFLGDERVGRWLGGAQDAQEAREALGRHIAHWDAHGFGLWIARDRADESFVGRGGLNLTIVGGHGEIEVGWAITPQLWGRGLATEIGAAAIGVAREPLGVEQVVSFTLPGNASSRRVMEKLGLSAEREVEHHGLAHVLYRGPTTTG
jgi:RimJ/RimL family protein N-acetyltransferase